MSLSLTGIDRLKRQILAAGVAITGLNTKGRVSPESLQKQAQPIIDGFDDSPAADEKYLAQQKYDEAHTVIAATDQTGIIIKAVVDVLAKEIAIAQPTYVAPAADVLIQKVQAAIDGKKPTD